MKIAVTGASGYIGGWLVEELRERGHTVLAQDCRRPDDYGTANSWALFDLADFGKRSRWLGLKPDVVVHLAALYGRVWGERDLTKTIHANVALTAELARDCERKGIRMVFASSSEVYGESAVTALYNLAEIPLKPFNMYGLSKKWGEEACRIYAPERLGIIRLNMPYGPAKFPPPPGTIPVTSGRAGVIGYNALHTMLWQASHGMDITVHRGTQRSLTWVGDSVKGMALVIEHDQAGTWNVGRNDDHLAVLDLAHRVLDLTGSSSKIIETDLPDQVTLIKRLHDGAIRDLGWIPEVQLDEGMKRSWDYFARFDREGKWTGYPALSR